MNDRERLLYKSALFTNAVTSLAVRTTPPFANEQRRR